MMMRLLISWVACLFLGSLESYVLATSSHNSQQDEQDERISTREVPREKSANVGTSTASTVPTGGIQLYIVV